MSALDVLKQIKSSRRAETKAKPVEWGSADFINSVGVEKLNGRQLRNHLEARDLSSDGTRLEQIERLRASLKDEQLSRFAYQETLQTENLINRELEERGSVYVVGNNSKGQLGVGDLLPRRTFTVVRRLRGVQASSIAAGTDMCFAVSEQRQVYVWGGGGVGRRGIPKAPPPKVNRKGVAERQETNQWLEPQLVEALAGEECSAVAVGSSHCVACSRSGDSFVWGDNDVGQLGLGSLQPFADVAINHSFPALRAVACGANHSTALAVSGEVYTWGHALNGRLGNGATERLGVSGAEAQCFPVPYRVAGLEPVTQVSCGADHTLAIGASGVWAWGCGSGGKLGLGDCADRWTPSLVPRTKGRSALCVSAGTWNSLVVIAFPPMQAGGLVYSFGSGYHGQLGLGSTKVSLAAELVEFFAAHQLLCRHVSAGSHHSAAVTIDGELYTWGSNKYSCLGRDIDELDVEYTSVPGHCGGFGALVDGTGRGLVRSAVCGGEFTVVSTWPYEGPDLETARLILEEQERQDRDDEEDNQSTNSKLSKPS